MNINNKSLANNILNWRDLNIHPKTPTSLELFTTHHYNKKTKWYQFIKNQAKVFFSQ